MNKIQNVVKDFLASSITDDLSLIVKSLPLSFKEWEEIIEYASMHGVLGIVFSQIEKLDKELLPPLDLLMEMLGQCQYQETVYDSQHAIISEFCGYLANRGVECKVLKGIAFSQYYKNPRLRISGDFDCYFASYFQDGNKLAEELGATFGESDYKHTHIEYKDLIIENHQYLTDFDNTKNGKRIEKYLRTLINEDCNRDNSSNALLPSDRFNAVFMIQHALHHFLNDGLTLRHVYDWAALMNKCRGLFLGNRIYQDLTYCRLDRFATVLTIICSNILNVPTSYKFPSSIDLSIANDVANDIFDGYEIPQGTGVLDITKRVFKRLKRQWHYRTINTEPYRVILWNTIAFSYYLHRKISIDEGDF